MTEERYSEFDYDEENLYENGEYEDDFDYDEYADSLEFYQYDMEDEDR